MPDGNGPPDRPQKAASPEAPLTVKRLLDQIKTRLEPLFASLCVIGEVSNFRGSGKHWYFTLKDDGAQIACAVWASQQRFLAHAPRDGQRVVLRGSLNVYVQGGTLTLVVTHCEAAGTGDLQARLRQLETQLRAEGLFDREKRPLPRFPRRLGVVAALGGAALQDVLEVTRRRAPGIHLLLAPAAAQGERCVPEVLAALEALQEPRLACDAILLVRGGGGLEDLWAYNDPAMVRAVAGSRIPVLTGVGHEIDISLVDLAADHRAATPSQAAELATPDLGRLRSELQQRIARLHDRLQWRLRGLESTVNLLADSRGMREVPRGLERRGAQLGELLRHLGRIEPMRSARMRLEGLQHRLHLAHPELRLEASRHRLHVLQHRLARLAPVVTHEDDRLRIQDLRRRAEHALGRLLATRARDLDVLAARLGGGNPAGPLRRGFVLVRLEDGRPATSAAGLPPLARLRLQWLDGERTARLDE